MSFRSLILGFNSPFLCLEFTQYYIPTRGICIILYSYSRNVILIFHSSVLNVSHHIILRLERTSDSPFHGSDCTTDSPFRGSDCTSSIPFWGSEWTRNITSSADRKWQEISYSGVWKGQDLGYSTGVEWIMTLYLDVRNGQGYGWSKNRFDVNWMCHQIGLFLMTFSSSSSLSSLLSSLFIIVFVVIVLVNHSSVSLWMFSPLLSFSSS